MSNWIVLAIDGNWGPATAKAFQSALRRMGYYTTAYKIDGDFGKASITALQKMLRYANPLLDCYPAKKYVIDGIGGKATWTGLWDWLDFFGFYSGGVSTGKAPWNMSGTNYNLLCASTQEWLNSIR